MSVIELRPHHALCVHFFEGKGYSEGFVSHMTDVIEKLCDDTEIEITDGCDTICSACPENADGICRSADKVSGIDKRAAEYMGIKPGERISWRRISALAMDKIIDNGKLKDVCRDCKWIDICCKER